MKQDRPEIIDIKELEGRTIRVATIWSDKESMSLLLDDGGILQIIARHGDEDNNFEPIIHYEIEYAPPKK